MTNFNSQNDLLSIKIKNKLKIRNFLLINFYYIYILIKNLIINYP